MYPYLSALVMNLLLSGKFLTSQMSVHVEFSRSGSSTRAHHITDECRNSGQQVLLLSASRYYYGFILEKQNRLTC